MKNIINIALSFMVIALISSTSVYAKDNLSWSNKIMGQGVIYDVVDGDTVWVNVSDSKVFNTFYALADTSYKKEALRQRYKSVKMRIANTNTEESVHRDSSKNSAAGKNSSNYLKSIASKKNAKFVCWDHGDYGRPICSVEFSTTNGYVDIGFRMITKGYSPYVTRWGKHPYAHKEYAEAAR